MNKGKPNTNTGGKKDFAPSLGFWPTKKGTGFSVKVTAAVIETLSKAQEGGRLYLQAVPEDKIRYEDDEQKTPSYRVTIFEPNEDNAL